MDACFLVSVYERLWKVGGTLSFWAVLSSQLWLLCGWI